MRWRQYITPVHHVYLRFTGSRVWRLLVALRGHQATWVLGITAAVFFVISYLVHRPGTQDVDLHVTRAIQAMRNPVSDALMVGFSFLGDTGTLMVVGIGMALLLFRCRMSRASILTLLCLTGVPLNYAIKGVFERPRPDATLVEVLGPTIGFSYPSGHAMATTMLYGFLALITWLHGRTPRDRFAGVVGFATTAFMVSMSRVYLGAHWFTDVMGGMTFGVFVLFIYAELYKWWMRDRTPVTEPA